MKLITPLACLGIAAVVSHAAPIHLVQTHDSTTRVAMLAKREVEPATISDAIDTFESVVTSDTGALPHQELIARARTEGLGLKGLRDILPIPSVDSMAEINKLQVNRKVTLNLDQFRSQHSTPNPDGLIPTDEVLPLAQDTGVRTRQVVMQFSEMARSGRVPVDSAQHVSGSGQAYHLAQSGHPAHAPAQTAEPVIAQPYHLTVAYPYPIPTAPPYGAHVWGFPVHPPRVHQSLPTPDRN